MKTIHNIDFVKPFYERSYNRTSIITGIDAILSSENIFVSAIPFSCDESPYEIFPEIEKSSRRAILINKNDDIQLFKLDYHFKNRESKKQDSGYFFIYKNKEYKNVYVALTIESSFFFTHALLPFIKSIFPRASLTFITHKRLKKLLLEFQINNQFTDLIITRASQRLRFEEAGKHKQVVPIVSWPEMDLNEAFNWVYQNNGWFQSLQFEAKRDLYTATVVYLTREGIVRTNNLFSKVFESFVLPVCKTIYENIEIFGHRSRRENPDLSARPLTIDFRAEQFSDSSENIKFIQSMKLLKTASISVLHGNPYINMSIIDYLDGSTFDLWVVNQSQLIIVPQMKGSIAAIKRLINHIFDKYAEGEIRDYEESLK